MAFCVVRAQAHAHTFQEHKVLDVVLVSMQPFQTDRRYRSMHFPHLTIWTLKMYQMVLSRKTTCALSNSNEICRNVLDNEHRCRLFY